MQIDPTALGATPVDTTTSADAALGQLGSDTFLKLLVAQLRYQNPLDPADGTQMLQQTAQFTQVETLQAISETNQQLMGLQQVTLAMSVVGKNVTAIGPDGNARFGTVQGVRFTPEGPMLDVDGIELALDNVLSVTAS